MLLDAHQHLHDLSHHHAVHHVHYYTMSIFMSNPGKEHWNAVKWILRYLKGTSNMCLRFGSGKPQLDGFTDSDMSADVDTSRSTSGYVMTYAGGVGSWQLRL